MARQRRRDTRPIANSSADNRTTSNASTDNNHPPHKMIHPIIIYPYGHPKDTKDLVALYEGLIRKLKANTGKYCEPVTVLNRQTHHRNKGNDAFKKLMANHVSKHSEILHTWSVDTCQMWLTGFGYCADRGRTTSDVYWLIPGDFNYASDYGKALLEKFEGLPNKVYDAECELCLGEITVPLNSSKQLIDTYGTYGLLYNWFPAQAQGLREITDKPRTEFFAIGHNYLDFVLDRRWYAYEQTIVILLQGMQGRRSARDITKFELGAIVDPDQGRGTLASAMQQVERTERVLKLYWRELNEPQDATWPDKFRKLDAQSEQIRAAALVILEQILR